MIYSGLASKACKKVGEFSQPPTMLFRAMQMQTLLLLFIASSSAWSSQATQSHIGTKFTCRRPEAHNIRSILFGDSTDIDDSHLSRHFNHGKC